MENNNSEMVNMVNIMKRKHVGSILLFAETLFFALENNILCPTCKKANQKSLGLETGSGSLEVKYRRWNTKDSPDKWMQFKHFSRGRRCFCGKEVWLVADAVSSDGWWMKRSPVHSYHPQRFVSIARINVGIVCFCRTDTMLDFSSLLLWTFQFLV